MAKPTRKPSAPLTFDLPESLLSRIETLRKGHGLASSSEVVRRAIEDFDFADCTPARDDHRQISVRLTLDQRNNLRRQARLKKVSVGELVRLALGAMPAKAKRK